MSADLIFSTMINPTYDEPSRAESQEGWITNRNREDRGTERVADFGASGSAKEVVDGPLVTAADLEEHSEDFDLDRQVTRSLWS